ncbi:MAG: (Fe-S)-binding protein [Deltaproteobacteria bacterium]|nr:(Fe-S)-binding protein [Deltaproteobacteria bacterium]
MDSEYTDIIHRCFRCGWCKLPTTYQDFNCPAYLKYRFESFASGGRMWLIRAWINGEIEASERFNQILFSCVTCRNCVEACALPKIKDKLVDIFIAARQDLVDQGNIPPAVRDYLKAMTVNGNPYKMPQEQRGAWAEGLNIDRYEDQEYLFYAGDVGSYDELGMKMARSTARLLKSAGLSFGILAEEETSDGNDVRAAGEKGLADYLAQTNIETFNNKGVKKIITLSPHGYNAFRNEYPALGGQFEVYHYTQVLNSFLGDKIHTGRYEKKVAYHDPCYLGRWNQEYFAPRRILGSIPGLKLAEMDRNMNNALCCGGGGGNFFTDILGTGPDLSSRARVREALSTGAEVIAVACPQCYKMLDDAVKDEGVQDRIRVSDIAGIILESGMK